MENNNNHEGEISVNLLKHLEDLTSQINKLTSTHTKNLFSRYPITFGLIILIGVITLNEGIKGVLKNLGIFNLNPLYLVIVGLLILIITGVVYKKLDK